MKLKDCKTKEDWKKYKFTAKLKGDRTGVMIAMVNLSTLDYRSK